MCIPTPPYTDDEWHKAEALVISTMARIYPETTLKMLRWYFLPTVVVWMCGVKFEFYMKDLVKGNVAM